MTRHIGVGLVCLIILAVAATVPSFAQDPIDVVYLKNGSIVFGTVVRRLPNDTITIETLDGNFIIFEMSDVEKIIRRPVAGPESEPEGADAAVTSPMAAHYLVVNPLGILEFGPVAEFGFRLTPRLYGLARVRFAGLGALSYLRNLFSGEMVAPWSTSVSTGIRYFATDGGSPNAPYIGAAAGIGFTPYGSGDGYFNSNFHGNCVYLTMGANAGYRWQFKKYILDLGAGFAFTPTLYDQWSFDSTPSVMHDGDVNYRFLAMVDVSIGWAL